MIVQFTIEAKSFNNKRKISIIESYMAQAIRNTLADEMKKGYLDSCSVESKIVLAVDET